MVNFRKNGVGGRPQFEWGECGARTNFEKKIDRAPIYFAKRVNGAPTYFVNMKIGQGLILEKNDWAGTYSTKKMIGQGLILQKKLTEQRLFPTKMGPAFIRHDGVKIFFSLQSRTSFPLRQSDELKLKY